MTLIFIREMSHFARARSCWLSARHRVIAPLPVDLQLLKNNALVTMRWSIAVVALIWWIAMAAAML
jgi:hypothetical protein